MPALGLSLGLPFRRASAASAPTYATWNPADSSTANTLSGDNLIVSNNTGSNWGISRSTISKTAGIWYTEHVFVGANMIVGVATADHAITPSTYLGGQIHGYGYYSANGEIARGAAFVAYGATYASGARIGVLWDAGAKTLNFRINGGAWQGNKDISALTGEVFLAMSGNAVGDVLTSNFGASAFTDAVPGGANSGLYV